MRKTTPLAVRSMQSNSIVMARSAGSKKTSSADKLARLGLRPLHLFPYVRAGDQPRAMVIGNVGPGPFDHHKKAIAEADQKEQVNKQPREPGEVARNVNLAGQVRDGVGASNRRQAAFVEILKMLARLPFYGSLDL